MTNDEEPVEDPADMKNDEWLKENYIGLMQEYPNQWIAVLDQQIVAHGVSKRLVSSQAEKVAAGRSFSLYFMEPSDIMP